MGTFKYSDDYKTSKLTEEDYLFASHQTRAFTYQSLNDDKAAIESTRDLVLAAGVVILSIFCPPAGAVAGFALAAADMYSAASGKDWGTGRELDDGERLMRGAFALFDLVPGVGYMLGLGKDGLKAGFAGIKASLKTSFKEGMEQAAKNVDNFKAVLKNVDDFRKQLITKVDDFGKQLDNLAMSKVSSLADNVAGKLRQVDETISTAAQNFRLNIGIEPQLIDGIVPPPSFGKLSALADNLQAFARNLEGSLDETIEASSKGNKHLWHQTDDIIRDGTHFDEFGNLKPNVTYQTGEFEYIYKTDELGRIKEWNADELHLTDRDKRLKHDPNTLGKIKGKDHAAHLAGDRFGGSPLRDNLISQLSGVNLSDYKKLENQWADALKNEQRVSVNVKINYVDGNVRPTSFDVEYIIDGEFRKIKINNY